MIRNFLLLIAWLPQVSFAQRSVGCFMSGQQVDACVCSGTCPSPSAGGSSAQAPTASSASPAPAASPTPAMLMMQSMFNAMQSNMQNADAAAARQVDGQAANARAVGRMEAQEGAEAEQRLLQSAQEDAAEDEARRQAVASQLIAPPPRSHAPVAPAAPPAPQTSPAAFSLARKALDCGLEPLFADSNDPAFAAGLKTDLARAYADLQRAPAGTSIPLTRDSVVSSKTGERQEIVAALLSLHGNGEIYVDTQFSVSKGGKKSLEGQSLVLIDPAGHILQSELSPSARRCLSKE